MLQALCFPCAPRRIKHIPSFDPSADKHREAAPPGIRHSAPRPVAHFITGEARGVMYFGWEQWELEFQWDRPHYNLGVLLFKPKDMSRRTKIRDDSDVLMGFSLSKPKDEDVLGNIYFHIFCAYRSHYAGQAWSLATYLARVWRENAS